MSEIAVGFIHYVRPVVGGAAGLVIRFIVICDIYPTIKTLAAEKAIQAFTDRHTNYLPTVYTYGRIWAGRPTPSPVYSKPPKYTAA